MSAEDPLLEVTNLQKHFAQSSGWIGALLGKNKPVRAVDGVDFSIGQGEIVSIVGESGCGKTTLGKSLLRLIEPSAGAINFRGSDITNLSEGEMREYRKEMQIVFQDPFQSLNPKKTVRKLVRQPLDIHDIPRNEAETRVVDALEDVGLSPVSDFLDRYPEEMSGGQLQRVSFARSLVLEPSFVVADEPTSMLDASIRARVLDLMEKLREERGISFLVITHDLSVARYLSDRVGVMYLGRLVEIGNADDMIMDPKHPYSNALIESIPSPTPYGDFDPADIEGEVPDPIDIPTGCRFHPRCPIATKDCKRVEPEWRTVPTDGTETRQVECHEVDPKHVPTEANPQ